VAGVPIVRAAGTAIARSVMLVLPSPSRMRSLRDVFVPLGDRPNHA
jgi:hypothetical protein